ncbi:response regulator transcription factor [Alkalilimnicola sp. S0819]|uniref:response regulator transcription factor n=1 Tax=Alkalilimnicola sp. S0819 TaxID=2613922 RepID=UPI00126254D5|nr:response regulator transcription factor [Alkalilimnicola sp. S0819]KAB7623809.1 response regulator transcription factor [Alkalilimnicola sp. S0819]MPQ16683.1 response regulator [Alkalilimnicola sp. S0819]
MNLQRADMPIVVVEDSPETRHLLVEYLRQQGYRVHEAADGAAFRELLRSLTPVLVILDIELPDTDGLTLAREAHRHGEPGIIFVTVRDNDFDRVAALELGGDDYITKPVNLRELLARVRSVLRRRQAGAAAVTTSYQFHGYRLDLVRRELSLADGERVPLTAGEFGVLAVLAAHRGQPVERGYLLEAVTSRDPLEVSERTVDTLVRRLRCKLETDPRHPRLVLTVPGVGYRLA